MSIETNFCMYAHFIYGKGGTAQWAKNSVFDKRCWDNWIAMWGRLSWTFCLLSCIQSIPSRSHNLNDKCETIKLFEDVEEYLRNPGTRICFLNSYWYLESCPARVVSPSGQCQPTCSHPAQREPRYPHPFFFSDSHHLMVVSHRVNQNGSLRTLESSVQVILQG